MASADDWRTLQEGFARLQGRSGGRLRADHQSGGWGRVEREMLQALSAGDPFSSAQKQFAPVRPELEIAAAAPPWILRYADSGHSQFRSLAGRGAVHGGYIGADGWIAWLDWLRVDGIGDQKRYDGDASSTLIFDVCGASIEYCLLLAAGHVPPVSAGGASDEGDSFAPASSTLAAEVVDVGPDAIVSNRQRVDACLRAFRRRTNRSMTRKEFWTGCGYTVPTEFQRWQRGDRKATKAASQNFERRLKDLESTK